MTGLISVRLCNLAAMVTLVIISAGALLVLSFTSSKSIVDSLTRSSLKTRTELTKSLGAIQISLEKSCDEMLALSSQNQGSTKKLLEDSSHSVQEKGYTVATETATELANKLMKNLLQTLSVQILNFLEVIVIENKATRNYIRDYNLDVTKPMDAVRVVKQMLSSINKENPSSKSVSVVGLNAHPLTLLNKTGFGAFCGVEGDASPVSIGIVEYGYLAQGYKVSDFTKMRGDFIWDQPCPYPQFYQCYDVIDPISSSIQSGDIYEDKFYGVWKHAKDAEDGPNGARWGNLWFWQSWVVVDSVFPIRNDKGQLLAVGFRSLGLDSLDKIVQKLVKNEYGQRLFLVLPEGSLIAVSHGTSKYLNNAAGYILPSASARMATDSEDLVIRQASLQLLRNYSSFTNITFDIPISVQIVPEPPIPSPPFVPSVNMPYPKADDYKNKCIDDPTGYMKWNGFTCKQAYTVIKRIKQFNVSDPCLSPVGTRTLLLQHFCPVTCGVCGTDFFNKSLPIYKPSKSCVDDPDGLVAKENYTCAKLLSTVPGISPCYVEMRLLLESFAMYPFALFRDVCQATCEKCAPPPPPPPPVVKVLPCPDDPKGLLAARSLSCPIALALAGNIVGSSGACDFDAGTVDPTLGSGMFVKLLCPGSCDSCPLPCPDDPKGVVKSFGQTCQTILSALIASFPKEQACGFDLHNVMVSLPVNTFVNTLCPGSCDNCAYVDINPTNQTNTKCVDDSDGSLKKLNTSCSLLLKEYKCTDSITKRYSSITQGGGLLNYLCPKSCKVCTSTEKTLTPTPTAIPMPMEGEYYMQATRIEDGRGTFWIAITLMPVNMIVGNLRRMNSILNDLTERTNKEVNEKISLLDSWVQSNLTKSRNEISIKVQESTMSAEKISKDSEDESNRKVKENQVVTLTTAAAILCCTCIVAAFINHLIVQPIYSLLKSMTEVSDMELEKAKEIQPSALYEIKTMQFSFARMVDQLIEYRSYMPQSVLVKEEVITDKVHSKKTLSSESSLTVSQGNQSKSRSTSISNHPTRTGIGLMARKVTVLVVNVRGFHAMLKKGHSVIQAQQDKLLSLLLAIAHENRGVPEPFLGDHLMVSFNAITPTTTHTLNACHMALNIMKSITVSSNGLNGIELQVGFCTGPAEVGNIGCKEMKRFSILGAVVNTSFLLQRLCTKYSINICTESNTSSHALSFYYCTVDRISFPKFSERPLLIQQLFKERKVADDEWMYEMHAGDADDPNGAHNEAWKLAIAGKFAEAQVKLSESTHPNRTILQSVILNNITNYVDKSVWWY